ncbi:MAG: hypothetical protein R2745_21530 [Vicinamibacterales bacterium]
MSLPKDIEPDRDEAQRRQLADPLVASAAAAIEAAGLTDCPDAELLALYAENQLGTSERHTVLPHLSTCERCQAIVAAYLAASGDAPEGLPAPPAPIAPEGTSDGTPSSWLFGWRWLVPAASLAAVAVVAVWIGRPAPADGPAPSTAGAVETQAARQPAPLEEAPASPPAPVDTRRADAPTPARTAQPPTAGGAAAATEAKQVASAELQEALARSRLSQARAAVNAPAPPAAAAPAPSAAAVPAPKAEDLADARTERARENVNAGAPAPEPAAGAAGVRALGAAMAASPWRVRGGRIERSTDGGRTWARVDVPTTEAFASIAVRAPDRIVATTVSGRTWTSTDDGATWRTP